MISQSKKILNIIISISLIFFLLPPINKADAVFLTNMTDVMSTQTIGANADHLISWTLGTGHTTAVGSTISIDFIDADFDTSGVWQTSDFAFTDDVRNSATPAEVGTGGATCGGSALDNYIVNVNEATNTFVITICNGWTTSAEAQATSFQIKGATGGTGILTNKASDIDSSIITIQNGGNDTDRGQMAVVSDANGTVNMTATVDEVLSFSLNTNSVSLGMISKIRTGSGSHTISVATNATNGFLVTYNGTTLTSGLNTIPPYNGAVSAIGTSGFGINLRDNTTPDVGADLVNNAGTCAVATDYGTANLYKFVASTETTITDVTAPADCVFTVSYVANVSEAIPTGSYATNLTYLASGNF